MCKLCFQIEIKNKDGFLLNTVISDSPGNIEKVKEVFSDYINKKGVIIKITTPEIKIEYEKE